MKLRSCVLRISNFITLETLENYSGDLNTTDVIGLGYKHKMLILFLPISTGELVKSLKIEYSVRKSEI